MQLYNFDNWYLEGMSILMTVVSLFTTAFFLSSILKDRENSHYPVWKYFILYLIAYAICRFNINTYEYRQDILFIAIISSCLIFSNDKKWKRFLSPFVWSVLNMLINGGLNSFIMIKNNITFSEFNNMSYEATLAISNADIYSKFCIQSIGYTLLAFVEVMILLFVNRKKVKTNVIFLINLFSVLLVCAANIPMYFMPEAESMVITGGFSFFISVVLMIYSYNRLKFYQEYSRTEAENKFLKEKEVMQLEYYNEMKIKEEKIRKINHDIKNNISVMYGLNNDKDREKFIEKIDEDLRQYELVKYSNNDILNIVLNTKISKAKELEIEVDVDVKNSISFMEDIDVSNLFTNILDNAIENSSLVDDKIIRFSIKKKLGNIIIECSNSYDGKVNYKDEKIKSRKNEEHGYGLRIIKDIVNKYDGEINILHDNDKFTITIMFFEAS